ncbi:MAG: M14 family zinc carboxypeptidase [Nocardioidaceae bacterium]
MRRMRWIGGAATFALVAALLAAAPTEAAPGGAGHDDNHNAGVSLGASQTALVRLQLPGHEMLDRLVARGADMAGTPHESGDGVLADVVVTGAQLRKLRGHGATVQQVIEREGRGTVRYDASKAAQHRRIVRQLGTHRNASAAAPTVNSDTLHFLKANWWTSQGQTFVQTEVATTATADVDLEITVTWRTADGRTGSFPLVRHEDAGRYLYHYNRRPEPLPAQPVQLTATSSRGGVKATTPSEWAGEQPPSHPEGYQSDFITSYMNPEDVRARMHRLARQYPDLVDLVDMSHKTHGYRRTATAYLGDPDDAAVVVESVKYGNQRMQGGPVNGVQARSIDPGKPNRALRAHFGRRMLTISLATDSTGAIISTTDDVAAFVKAKFPRRFNAFVEDGSSDKTMPVAGPVRLDSHLDAPAGVPHHPWQLQALRIGYHRDGSRIGVLAYSQEHAREWATPLVTLEFAERLLANAATDPKTHRLLEDVDVFVVPVTNPDGANYSFNDYNFQRKNMDNHCTGSDRDPKWQDRWGVDVNRNYTVGSYFDGYVGASGNCLSGVYAGTSELSEAESSSVIALAEAHPNIKYAMNVHSYGGYFMWPPGAYRMPGRILLPPPSIDESKQFLDAAERIVGAIKTYRGTVTWPKNTGPVADVLYSAAGNSADQLYYEDGIFAWDFEIGNDIWDPETQTWEGVGFQPSYPEAHGESQEYAAGLMELVRVAADAQEQSQRPDAVHTQGHGSHNVALSPSRQLEPTAQ